MTDTCPGCGSGDPKERWHRHRITGKWGEWEQHLNDPPPGVHFYYCTNDAFHGCATCGGSGMVPASQAGEFMHRGIKNRCPDCNTSVDTTPSDGNTDVAEAVEWLLDALVECVTRGGLCSGLGGGTRCKHWGVAGGGACPFALTNQEALVTALTEAQAENERLRGVAEAAREAWAFVEFNTEAADALYDALVLAGYQDDPERRQALEGSDHG